MIRISGVELQKRRKMAPGMKKIDLFNDKLKQKKVKELRESSNITETPHEEKGRDDWLHLPPSSQTKKKGRGKKKKRLTTQTKEDRETQMGKTIQLEEGDKPSEEQYNLLLSTNTEVQPQVLQLPFNFCF